MPDPLKRVTAQPANAPDVRRITSLLYRFPVKALVFHVGGFGFLVIWLAHGVEIKEVPPCLRKPSDLLMPVRKEALIAHSIRIVPDNQVYEKHLAMLSQVGKDRQQVPRTCLTL